MKRRRVGVWSLPSVRQVRGLMLMAGMFAVGAVLGCCWAVWMKESSSEALREYLQGFLSLPELQKGALPERLGKELRLPMLVVLLRFASLGALLIPPLCSVKGFLLSFSVASFVKSYGWRGELASLAVYAPSALLETAVLLYLSAECWEASLRLGLRPDAPSPLSAKGFLRMLLVCLVLLTVEALLQQILAQPVSHLLGWLIKG